MTFRISNEPLGSKKQNLGMYKTLSVIVDKNLIRKSTVAVRPTLPYSAFPWGRLTVTLFLSVEPFVFGVEGGDTDVYDSHFSYGSVASAGLDKDTSL